MAKRNGSTSSLTRRQSLQLGPLGFIVWALPPSRRAFLRDATRVTATAGGREIDRTAMLKRIDTAFDEIEAAVAFYERMSA